MNAINVDGLTKRFGSGLPVLDHVSFSVPAGSFTCLLGPSGSGKSTILACLAGLLEPDSGTIQLNGSDTAGTPAHRRPVTLVLQTAQLFPFLTVGENVAFGLKVRRIPARQRTETAARFLDLVGLEAFANRETKGLSGGEQQRVALARALAIEPSVVLLDEPLASLDPPVRRELQDLLADIHERTGTTFVLVTHDIDEAIALADQLIILDGGRVVASGTPTELYERPGTLAAARLLGFSNILRGTVEGTVLHTEIGPLPVDLRNACSDATEPRSSTWVIRPEHVEVSTNRTGGPDAVSGHVVTSRYQGNQTELHVQVGPTQLRSTVATGTNPIRRGDAVVVRIPARWLTEVDDQ
jgi:ABC-type Fe3+/spermidine/putrescine transport system ATPase subunit